MRYSQDELQMMAQRALWSKRHEHAQYEALVDRLANRLHMHHDDVEFHIRLLAA